MSCSQPRNDSESCVLARARSFFVVIDAVFCKYVWKCIGNLLEYVCFLKVILSVEDAFSLWKRQVDVVLITKSVKRKNEEKNFYGDRMNNNRQRIANSHLTISLTRYLCVCYIFTFAF